MPELDPATDPLGAAKEMPYVPDAATDPLGAAKEMPAGDFIPSKEPGVAPLSAEHHLKNRLQQDRTWEEVAPELKDAGIDPERYRQNYQLSEAHAVQKQQPLSMSEAYRQNTPFGFLGDASGIKAYGAAKRRYDEGKGTKEDAHTIAEYERIQGQLAGVKESFLGKVVTGVGGLSQVGAEMGVGGAALGQVARVPGAIGRGASALGFGAEAAAPATRLGQVGQFLGNRAALTATAPSFFVDQARQTNVAAGREADDIRGYPTAIAMGYANNLVLGSLQSKIGAGMPGGLFGRSAAKGTLGAGEAAGVEAAGGIADEFLNDAYKTNTKYGPLGKLLGIRQPFAPGEAVKDFAATAVTFSLFSGLHGAIDKPELNKEKAQAALDKAVEAIDSAKTPEEAAQKVKEIAKVGSPGEDGGKSAQVVDTKQSSAREPVHPLDTLSKDDLRDLAAGLGTNPTNLRKTLADPAKAQMVVDAVLGRQKAPPEAEKPPAQTPAEAPIVAPERSGEAGKLNGIFESMLAGKNDVWEGFDLGGGRFLKVQGRTATLGTKNEADHIMIEFPGLSVAEGGVGLHLMRGAADPVQYAASIAGLVRTFKSKGLSVRIGAEHERPLDLHGKFTHLNSDALRQTAKVLHDEHGITIEPDGTIQGPRLTSATLEIAPPERSQEPVSAETRPLTRAERIAALGKPQEPVQEHTPATQPGDLHEAIRSAGLEARADKPFGETVGTIGEGKNQIILRLRPEVKSVQVDFGETGKTGEPIKNQLPPAATMSLGRNLLKLAEKLRDKGLSIDYKVAEGPNGERRHEVFTKVLTKAGFQMEAEKGTSGEYIWRPKQTVGEQLIAEHAAQPAKHTAETLRREGAEHSDIAASLESVARHAESEARREVFGNEGAGSEAAKPGAGSPLLHPEAKQPALPAANPPAPANRSEGVAKQQAKNLYKPQTLAGFLSKEGIRERDAGLVGIDVEGVKESEATGTGGLFRKNGRPLEDIIPELVRSGDLPANVDPLLLPGILGEKLKRGALYADMNSPETHYEKQYEAYVKKQMAEEAQGVNDAKENLRGVDGKTEPEIKAILDALEKEAGREAQEEHAAVRAESARPGEPGHEPGETADADFRPWEFGGVPLGGAESRTPPTGHALTAERMGEPKRQTALANEVTDKEREANNLPPLMAKARLENERVWDAAMQRIDADPRAETNLIDELAAKPRTTTVEENALLLHRRIDLTNQHTRAMRELLTAKLHSLDPTKLDPLEARQTALLAEIDRVDQVIRSTGTEAGRAFQFRRQLAREDFSLSTMLGRAEIAKGKPLTVEEKAEITAMHDKIRQLEAALAAAEAVPELAGKKGEKGDVADMRIEARAARRVFADKITAMRDATLPAHKKVIRFVGETFNSARSIITAFDLSAVFRQGGFTAFSRPITAARAVPEMLRSFASEHAYERAQDAIHQRANALLYEKSGLYLADKSGPLAAQEEAFIGRWTGRIPGVKASERAYNAFLNRIRADVFDSMTASMSRKAAPTDAEAKAIANFINVATGRGKLGAPFGTMEKAAVPLAHLFFSPRFVVSRFQILTGQPLYGGSLRTRAMVASEYARALAGLGLFYALASMDDQAKITFDPRSTDFGKIRWGNTRLDPLAGLSQAAVFVTRVTSGEEKNSKGAIVPLRDQMRFSAKGKVPFGGDDVATVIGRFIRTKFAPVPGAATDALVGKNVVGEPTTVTSTAAHLAVPMSVRDVYESLTDQGVPRGAAIGLLAVLGMGTQTYEPKGTPKQTSAVERWGKGMLQKVGVR